MSARDNRRVLLFVLAVALLFALAVAGYHRFGRRATPEERAREKAEQLRGRVHDLTHGK